jgi:hypothetical protein
MTVVSIVVGYEQDDLSLLLDLVCAKIGNVYAKIGNAYSKIEVSGFRLPVGSSSSPIYIRGAGIPPIF